MAITLASMTIIYRRVGGKKYNISGDKNVYHWYGK